MRRLKAVEIVLMAGTAAVIGTASEVRASKNNGPSLSQKAITGWNLHPDQWACTEVDDEEICEYYPDPPPPPYYPPPPPPPTGGGTGFSDAVDPANGCYGGGTANGSASASALNNLIGINGVTYNCNGPLMGHVYPNPTTLVGQPLAGTGQCVDTAFKYLNATPTGQWKQGSLVKGASLTPGTAIGSGFDANGNFPINDHGQHYAFYVSQDANYLYVVDQWTSLTPPTIQQRRIPWSGNGNTSPSNIGNDFYTVNWPDCGQ